MSRSVGRRQEVSKLVDLDLAGVVFIDVLDELLDVNRHLELLFNDADEALSVDRSISVLLPTHCDEGIQCVLFVCDSLSLLLSCYDSTELLIAEALLLSVGLRHHAEDLLLVHLLAHHFQHDAQLVRIHLPLVVLV